MWFRCAVRFISTAWIHSLNVDFGWSFIQWSAVCTRMVEVAAAFENTFGLGLMAMRAADWMEVTGYQGSIEGLLSYYR